MINTMVELGKKFEGLLDSHSPVISNKADENLSLSPEEIQNKVKENALSLGFDEASASRMANRIPTDSKPSFGLNTSIALALGYAPTETKELIVTHHSEYNENIVGKIYRAIHDVRCGSADPDSPIVYWLALSNIIKEDVQNSVATFMEQLELAKKIQDDPRFRLQQANEEIQKINDALDYLETSEDIGYGTQENSIQAAYFSGKYVGIYDARDNDGVFYVGTYKETEVDPNNFGVKEVYPGFYVTDDYQKAVSIADEIVNQLEEKSRIAEEEAYQAMVEKERAEEETAYQAYLAEEEKKAQDAYDERYYSYEEEDNYDDCETETERIHRMNSYPCDDEPVLTPKDIEDMYSYPDDGQIR